MYDEGLNEIYYEYISPFLKKLKRKILIKVYSTLQKAGNKLSNVAYRMRRYVIENTERDFSSFTIRVS